MSDSVIRTEDLTVYYGKKRGIIDVELDVMRGELFGLLGPNGSGKTTILRLLMDIIRPTSGTATIFGRDVRRYGVRIRHHIGYVQQTPAFPALMNGRDYLALVDNLRTLKSNIEYRRKLTARFDLDISQRIDTYSKANKQKLALIAAFMHRPSLLLLDEPTSGLDPLVQAQLVETMREAKNEGQTVLFSSHNLSEVQAVCDYVAMIKDGRLIATEDINALLDRKIRRITFQFLSHPSAAIEDIHGVTTIRAEGLRYTFEVENRLSELMEVAAMYGIEDIETHAVSLENLFLSSYAASEEVQDG